MNKKVGVSFEKASEGGEKGGFESRISRRIKFSSPHGVEHCYRDTKGTQELAFFFLVSFFKRVVSSLWLYRISCSFFLI